MSEGPEAPASTTAVVTRARLAAPSATAWSLVIYYEEIAWPPSLLLRLLLPVPVGTEGRKDRVGDVARCLYREGHLLKRVTQVDQGRRYGFEILEQSLPLAGGIRLRGGSYTFRSRPEGDTEVELETRYESRRRPRWLWNRIEAIVCHAFHRHILEAMRASGGRTRTVP
jgi:hypothetical protein